MPSLYTSSRNSSCSARSTPQQNYEELLYCPIRKSLEGFNFMPVPMHRRKTLHLNFRLIVELTMIQGQRAFSRIQKQWVRPERGVRLRCSTVLIHLLKCVNNHFQSVFASLLHKRLAPLFDFSTPYDFTLFSLFDPMF